MRFPDGCMIVYKILLHIYVYNFRYFCNVHLAYVVFISAANKLGHQCAFI